MNVGNLRNVFHQGLLPSDHMVHADGGLVDVLRISSIPDPVRLVLDLDLGVTTETHRAHAPGDALVR